MASLFYDAEGASKDPSKSEDLYDISLHALCVCVCVCVCVFNGEMYTPAQLQAGEPSLSALCDVFNIGLVATQFLVDISFIVCLNR